MMYGLNEGDEVIILRTVTIKHAISTRMRELIHGTIVMKVADEVNEWGYVVQCTKIIRHSLYSGDYSEEDFVEKSELFNTFIEPDTVLDFGYYSEDDWEYCLTCMKRMATAMADLYSNKENIGKILRRSRGKDY